MAGRCNCSGNAVTGVAATATGCVTVSGSGTSASPFSFGLGASCLPTIECLSTARPPSPAPGQRIFETDTRKQYVWSGLAWLRDDPLDAIKTLSVVPPALWTTGSLQFVNWDSVGGSPGGSPANQIAFTKRRDDTLLHCSVHASGYFHPTGPVGLVQMGFNVNAVGDFSTLTPKYPPGLNQHYAMHEEFAIPGLAAGSYAVTLRVLVAGGIGVFALDGNDYSTMTVREVVAA